MSTYRNAQSHSCGCIGPQNGQPLCPCRMRGVTVQDGRYVEIIDHGPAANVERRRENLKRFEDGIRDIYTQAGDRS